ncbi:acyl-CoA/acyl-ACP dehydrogenase [Micromonospora sp. CPCC 205371]|nr:acyl-CoA/acyl-ACP dehydrogenase [Micromonospora sp. CPCC 205371]
MDDLIDKARWIADEVLFPAALEVDGSGVLPAGHLDLLAREGFYGMAGPPEAGGLAIPDLPTAARLVEVLASGCLATTFVWMQHHGAVGAVARAERADLKEEWLEPLCRGVRRAGVVLAALRPGPPSVRATAVPGGYRLDGAAPWVTGWGMIDVLHTAARDENDMIVWSLVDAVPGPTLSVRPLRLVAADASSRVEVRFAGHFVPAERVTGTLPFADWPARDAAGLRMNGSFALGVAGRCVTLMSPPAAGPGVPATSAPGVPPTAGPGVLPTGGPGVPAGAGTASAEAGDGAGALRAELESRRTALDAATPGNLPAARAAASEFAMRAATILAVTAGARSVRRDDHAQRLVREAMFLLVFGSRPAIRAELLARLQRPPRD